MGIDETGSDSLSGSCRVCGKLIRGDSGAGSMTGWILGERGSTCSCDHNDNLPDLGPGYRILEALGSGGMGSVYKVEEVGSGAILAAKVMHEHLYTDGDSQVQRRFEREIETMSALSHPGLVKVEGFGRTEDGRAYLLMELVEGCSLAEVLSRVGNLEEKIALPLFIRILEGLEYMHSHKIVHRDLKPSNVLVVMDAENELFQDQAKIVDFGLAKVVRNESLDATAITRTGDIFGSPLYMSPEQCQGDEVSIVSDIYSFGCLMYEVLIGKPPFEDDNPVKIVLQHLYDSPRSPSSFVDRSISASLEDVILICLAKNPQERYQSARQLREDLERICEDRPIKKKPVDTSAYLVKVARGLLSYVVGITVVFAVVLGVILVQDYSWLVNLSRVNSLSYLEEKEKLRLATELVRVAGSHNKPFAMLKLAEVYYQVGERDKAEETLDQALSILTARGDRSQNRQPFLRLQMAIALDRGNLVDADRHFAELLKLAGDGRLNREGVKGIGVFRGFYLPSPVVNSIDVVNDYADACMARGYLKRAGELYSKVASLSIDKGDTLSCFEAYRNTADLYRRQGKEEQAKELRNKARALLDSPPLSRMRYPLQELGDDCVAAQDFAGALQIYRKLVSLPEEDRSIKILDRLRLAYGLTLSGNVDAAEAIYKELYGNQSATYDTPEGRRLLRAYANFEIGRKQFTRAESILDQLLNIYSRNGNFMRMATVSIKRAICVAGMGEGKRAETIYEKAVEAFGRIDFGNLQDDRIFEEAKFLMERARFKEALIQRKEGQSLRLRAQKLFRHLSPNTRLFYLRRDRGARIIDADYHFDDALSVSSDEVVQ